MNSIAKTQRSDFVKMNDSHTMHTDVLIIGAGLAGLSTALALPKSLSITILSKAQLQACSSHYAQGGIAASLDKNDSVKDHVADTLVAGAGLCAVDNTTSILSAGQQAVQWLCEQGVPFTSTHTLLSINDNDRTAKTVTLTTDELHLTQEGGHGCRRVAHADDATGRHIMEALTIKAQAASNITILPFHEALSLLTEALATEALVTETLIPKTAIRQHATIANRCQGAVVFDHHNQRQRTIHSTAVVMASGGLGQLFARASAPNVCVGDGVMMAWEAGCRLANLEFVQFHPTGLALGNSSFLISEALRGEGGHLYCPLTGKRFMMDIDERAELAPRDIVARAIAEQIRQNGLGYVHLDVSHLPASFLREHFPQIATTLLELGIDITTTPIPVAPTAHYSCGGIVTCAQGLSDVQGLYAAGEVAYTGLHGANRLASNSLLECIVVGRNIATHLPRYLATAHWSRPLLADTQTVALSNAALPNSNTTSEACFDLYNNLNNSDTIQTITTQLKSLMTNNMGIVRHAEPLVQALSQLQHWQHLIAQSTSLSDADHRAQGLMDTDIAAIGLSHFKLMRQLRLATLIVHSALGRHESRGGHYRQDYPITTITPLVSVIEPYIGSQIKSSLLANTLTYYHDVNQTQLNNECFQALDTV